MMCLDQSFLTGQNPPILTESKELFQNVYFNVHRLPTTTSGKLSLGALRGGVVDTPPMSQADLLTSCSVLCTADYCLETTQQLESKLKDKIDQSLSEKVSFESETESFHR